MMHLNGSCFRKDGLGCHGWTSKILNLSPQQNNSAKESLRRGLILKKLSFSPLHWWIVNKSAKLKLLSCWLKFYQDVILSRRSIHHQDLNVYYGWWRQDLPHSIGIKTLLKLTGSSWKHFQNFLRAFTCELGWNTLEHLKAFNDIEWSKHPLELILLFLWK